MTFVRRAVIVLLKVLLGLAVGLGLAVVGALIALRVPSVQTRVARQITQVLSRRLRQEVSINRVDVRPFSSVLLDGVRVRDRRGGELLSIGRAEADITLFSVFDPRHLHVGQLTLTEPHFELKNLAGQPDSTTLDQLLGAVKRLVGPSTDTTKSAPFDFQVERVALRNGQFIIERQDAPRETTYGRTIDYRHMRVDSLYADISNLRLGDTLRLRLQGLRAVEVPSKTHLKELTADIAYHQHFWEFAGLNLRVNGSQLRDYLRFEYRTFGNFSNFNDSMRVVTRLRDAHVRTEDIAQFAPQLLGLHEAATISGRAEGYVRDFKAEDLDVRYGRGTRLRAARAHADNLTHLREAFVDLRLRPSVIETADLKHFLPPSANKLVQRLGRVKLNGQLLGFYSDFVANASFDTALGRVVSDVNLKVTTDFTRAAYEGTIQSTSFQLGKFLGDESVVRDVTLNGKIKGVGFDPNIARGQADLRVARIWLSGHRYQNLTLNGRYHQQAFEGRFTTNDPALQLTSTGRFDLDRPHQVVDVQATIRRADLRALGLTTQPLVISTTADVHSRGLQLDSLIGYARLRRSTFTLGRQTLRLDTLDVVSARAGSGRRHVAITSEAADVEADGVFNTAAVVRDVQTLVTEYRLNFESNAAATAAYYRRKRQQALPEYRIDLKLNLKRLNPVLAVFMPDLQIADRSRIDGSFRNGATSIFQLGGHFDSLRYGPVRTSNTDFDLNTSKLPYRPEVLASANVTSDRQVLPGLGRTERFYVEGVWDQQRINFSTSLAQTGTTNKATINGALGFLPRAVEVVFRQSGLHLLDQDWTIAENNAVRISDFGREFDVQNFSLQNGEQQVSAQGYISRDADRPPLQLDIKQFQLTTLRALTGQRLAGRLNAQATVSGIYGPLTIDNTLRVDSLRYNDVLVGQVLGRSTWDNPAKKLRLNLDVARDDQRVLTVAGYLAPSAEQDQLHLDAQLEDAPLVLAQPFLESIFKNVNGTGQGELHLTGRFDRPELTGAVDVRNGQFTFGYLGTTYTFADRISFTNRTIAFRNIRLRDALGNTGTVDGVVRHQGFKDMSLTISAAFRKMQVLNTTRKDNELYFGTAYATGTASVTGPADNLVVNVRATSEAGTRMSLPLDNAAKAQKAGYIKFVNNNRSDTVITKQAVAVTAADKVDLSGLQLNMNLTVTPDAYMEILLDESTGDIIRGTAAGQLRLNIDTRGAFNMYGQVEIVRGAYNFTLQGLVNKEFQVRPGGLISWNGDPLAGEMNVTAAYTQRTSLAPVLENTSGGGAVVPVTAVMTLTGPLLLPVIRLGLEFNDAPGTLQGDLAAFTASLRNDEQELNRQVFSLLVFKQLSPRGSFGNTISFKSGENNTVSNSLGQILSTQLGLLTSQIDQNLEIDFNINGLSAEQLQALQVRLSYSFLNGRLRVTREGGFTNGANYAGTGQLPGAANARQVSLLGDLSLEYFLRPDGKFRARLRYETTPRDLYVEGVNQTRAGLSLLHTEQFDTFGELFRRETPKKKERDTQRAREVLTVDEDPRSVL
ncbi:translocation/assembly module TamB domain-containing protein [uncultured Hymenobacter sp.]|uniref:translocation/assembly module TamB domain-containing protein n=1 Tax=uncultured Hymenobacter sp. TaxID=170016 RepID=UPI0035CA9BCE